MTGMLISGISLDIDIFLHKWTPQRIYPNRYVLELDLSQKWIENTWYPQKLLVKLRFESLSPELLHQPHLPRHQRHASPRGSTVATWHSSQTFFPVRAEAQGSLCAGPCGVLGAAGLRQTGQRIDLLRKWICHYINGPRKEFVQIDMTLNLICCRKNA